MLIAAISLSNICNYFYYSLLARIHKVFLKGSQNPVLEFPMILSKDYLKSCELVFYVLEIPSSFCQMPNITIYIFSSAFPTAISSERAEQQVEYQSCYRLNL